MVIIVCYHVLFGFLLCASVSLHMHVDFACRLHCGLHCKCLLSVLVQLALHCNYCHCWLLLECQIALLNKHNIRSLFFPVLNTSLRFFLPLPFPPSCALSFPFYFPPFIPPFSLPSLLLPSCLLSSLSLLPLLIPLPWTKPIAFPSSLTL